MKETGLKNNERYESESAHITFCRFREKLKNPEKFMRLIDENRKYEIGKERIDRLELVEHDWYNQESKRRLLRCFSLGQ